MPENLDMRVVGLLCSHLCHEVVNPLGAVNNGIELLLDVGDDMRDEAMGLIESSAQRAVRRVQFYRMAYGTAGMNALNDLAEVRALVDGLLSEGRISLEWPDADRNPDLKQGWGRLLLNIAAAAAETMPRGGVITIEVGDSGGIGGLAVTARGDRAAVPEATRPIFLSDVPVESLTPRNVQSYFTVKFAATLGASLTVADDGNGEVRFEVAAA